MKKLEILKIEELKKLKLLKILKTCFLLKINMMKLLMKK